VEADVEADADAEDLLICEANMSGKLGSSINDFTFRLSIGMSKSIPLSPRTLARSLSWTPSKVRFPNTTLVVPVCRRLLGCLRFRRPTAGDGLLTIGSLNDTDRFRGSCSSCSSCGSGTLDTCCWGS
jgi:hypothetical protein